MFWASVLKNSTLDLLSDMEGETLAHRERGAAAHLADVTAVVAPECRADETASLDEAG
jgi:hypothetical protein